MLRHEPRYRRRRQCCSRALRDRIWGSGAWWGGVDGSWVCSSERAWVVVRMYDYGHDGSEELLWLYDSGLGLRIGSRDFGEECMIGLGDDIYVSLCITGLFHNALLS